MALYEYECKHCHETFDETVEVAGSDEVKCPSCGGEDIGKRFVLNVKQSQDTDGEDWSCDKGSCCFGPGCDG